MKVNSIHKVGSVFTLYIAGISIQNDLLQELI